MTTLWSRVVRATGAGHQSFRIRLGDNGEPKALHLCPFCDTTFQQDDEGREALIQHEFEQHEAPRHFDWRELHGKKVEIAFVECEEENPWGMPDRFQRTDKTLWARDEDGVIYSLPHLIYDFSGGSLKWKPRSPKSNLSRLMLPEAE